MESSGGTLQPVAMPSVEVGMTEGCVLELLVRSGDEVRVGQPLFTIEADKVTIELESPAAGRVAEILISPGSIVPVGEPVLLLDTSRVPTG